MKHSNRIVRAEHGDRGSEADALGLPGDRGEHHLRARHREVWAMMLAHTEEVQTCLIGDDGVLEDVADHLRVRKKVPFPSRVSPPQVSRPNSVALMSGDNSAPGAKIPGAGHASRHRTSTHATTKTPATSAVRIATTLDCMATDAEVAQWMVDEIRRSRSAEQVDIVDGIEREFGSTSCS